MFFKFENGDGALFFLDERGGLEFLEEGEVGDDGYISFGSTFVVFFIDLGVV